jgi:hypothetical protein
MVMFYLLIIMILWGIWHKQGRVIATIVVIGKTVLLLRYVEVFLRYAE